MKKISEKKRENNEEPGEATRIYLTRNEIHLDKGMSTMAKLKDIATAANVSISTVSRVLNGHTTVDQELAQRVMDAASQLGFKKNSGKSTGKSIAFLVTWPSQSPGGSPSDAIFMTSFFNAALLAAETSGYEMVFHYGGADGELSPQFRRQVLENRIAGAIVLGTYYEMERRYIQHLRKVDIPFFRLSRASKEYSFPQNYVAVDDFHGGYTATKHFLSLGHRKILHLAGARKARDAAERYQGAVRAIQEAGMSVDAMPVFHGDFHEHSGTRCAEEIASMDEPPTAVFAGNDIMAIGLMRRCKELGIRVPEDLGVIGFDGLVIGEYVTPALSTIASPMERITAFAVEELVKEIEQPMRRFTKMVLEGSLVIRESCGTKLQR